MSVKRSLLSIKNSIPNDICLVAVSKTKLNDLILEAYESGQRVFGENKVQELVDKYGSLPDDIEWHMIGHLQTNKVKYIAPFINLIHSVDSIKLIKEINKKAKSNNRVIDCLIQVHIAKEESKFGISLSEVDQFYIKCLEYENVRVKGIMGMATFTKDTDIVSKEFKSLKLVYDKLKSNYPAIEILSCGMSGDYNLAIEQGSNMIRIGSTIFGGR